MLSNPAKRNNRNIMAGKIEGIILIEGGCKPMETNGMMSLESAKFLFFSAIKPVY